MEQTEDTCNGSKSAAPASDLFDALCGGALFSDKRRATGTSGESLKDPCRPFLIHDSANAGSGHVRRSLLGGDLSLFHLLRKMLNPSAGDEAVTAHGHQLQLGVPGEPVHPSPTPEAVQVGVLAKAGPFAAFIDITEQAAQYDRNGGASPPVLLEP